MSQISSCSLLSSGQLLVERDWLTGCNMKCNPQHKMQIWKSCNLHNWSTRNYETQPSLNLSPTACHTSHTYDFPTFIWTTNVHCHDVVRETHLQNVHSKHNVQKTTSLPRPGLRSRLSVRLTLARNQYDTDTSLDCSRQHIQQRLVMLFVQGVTVRHKSGTIRRADVLVACFLFF